jgi:hypothetical protein
MNLIQWIRTFFNLDPHLKPNQVSEAFLKKASVLAKRGHVEIMKGGYRTLEKAMSDLDNTVFIISINKKYIPKPKPVDRWFKDYVSSSRITDYEEDNSETEAGS